MFYQLYDSLSAEADAPRWRSLRFALTETLRERHIFEIDRTLAEHLDE